MKTYNNVYTNRLFRCILGLAVLLLPLSFAQASVSLSIQSLSPSNNVPVGTTVSFSVLASGFINPNFALTDSFLGGSMYAGNLGPTGIFNWTPNTNDVGAHSLTITATDSYGNTASMSEQIVVSAAPTATIQSLSPGSTVNVGTPVNFTVSAPGFVNPLYSLIDSFGGTTMSNSKIDSFGNFNWTPVPSDTGTHVISINVTDSAGHRTTISQTIVVQSPTPLTITNLMPSAMVPYGTPITFTVYASGFANPVFTLGDSFQGTSLTSQNIGSIGNFSWVPNPNDIGTHNVTINATDSLGHNATIVQQLVVQTTGTAPSPATVTNQSGTGIQISSVNPGPDIPLGSVLTFTVTPSGFFNPIYSVGDSFSGTTISNSNMTSAGFFNWMPTSHDLGEHIIGVTATDNYGHNSSANVDVNVVQSSASIAPQPVPVTTPTTVAPVQTTVSTPPQPVANVFDTYLSPGSTGSEVTALQTILGKQGFFSGTPNGNYGPLTETAVENFQTAHNLPSLGVVGPQTRNLLNNLQSLHGTSDGYKFYNSLTLGSTNADVTELQKRLTANGVYTGPITGYFGSLTESAVKRYQSLHNLSQLGNVGPGTRAALNSGS